VSDAGAADGGDLLRRLRSPVYPRGIADGILPTIASFQERGFYAIADSVVPSFTNPNNASIVTGVPPPCTASPATTTSTAPQARSA
jgi:predicted AlkP superfamily pyrophosphatase or phosphodiesterase